MDFDGDRDGVEGGHEERTLPEDQGHGGEREQNPEQAAQAATGHDDAAAAVGVGVQAVPPHQLFDCRRLGPPHRQILLDFGFDLLSRSHGEAGTWTLGRGGEEKQVSSQLPPPRRAGRSLEARLWETPAHVPSEATFLFPSGVWTSLHSEVPAPFPGNLVFWSQ